MVAERRSIDIEKTDSLLDLLSIIEQEHAPVSLRRDGKIVAIVSPPDDTPGNLPPKRGTVEALLAFAGALPNAFPDDFIEEARERRQIPSRTFDWE